MDQATIDRMVMEAAYQQAAKSLREGGIPIGAALAGPDGAILAVGHNLRVQAREQIAHAEMVCLRNAGVGRTDWGELTMATTLSPCAMCSGAAVLHGLRRVLIADNENFQGMERWLVDAGIEVRLLRDERCVEMMREWIPRNRALWGDDVPTLPR
jgi:cytosine deaminase